MARFRTWWESGKRKFSGMVWRAPAGKETGSCNKARELVSSAPPGLRKCQLSCDWATPTTHVPTSHNTAGVSRWRKPEDIADTH